MALQFAPGDDLIFQLESGYGLLRVVKIELGDAHAPVWHLLAYEELFPDVESAEAALSGAAELHARSVHLAITDRALEKTPAARLGNRPVTEDELTNYRTWSDEGGGVSELSVLLTLGLR
ncbi:MAG: hypothetical protein WKF30_13065 [Pyrinomonadaceae bacterium]